MHLTLALPKPAETGSGGGADYMDGLAAALRTQGHRVELSHGADPAFQATSLPVIDGMLLPTLRARLDELVAADAVAVVHHLSAAAGRDDAARAGVLATEREMLPRFRRVVATSAPVAARLLSELAVHAITLPPGARDLPRTEPDLADPVVLAVGVLTPRKGHDLLLRAAARLTDLPWRLVIAGDSGRAPAHARELDSLIGELGLASRAALIADPAPQMLEHAWRSATVFALATRWEGYATAVAEALRRGIPSLVTEGGDSGALLPAEAGLVCPADDMATFGKCLRRLLFDDVLRTDMAEVAWRVGRTLPGWAQRAREFLAVLEG